MAGVSTGNLWRIGRTARWVINERNFEFMFNLQFIMCNLYILYSLWFIFFWIFICFCRYLHSVVHVNSGFRPAVRQSETAWGDVEAYYAGADGVFRHYSTRPYRQSVQQRRGLCRYGHSIQLPNVAQLCISGKGLSVMSLVAIEDSTFSTKSCCFLQQSIRFLWTVFLFSEYSWKKCFFSSNITNFFSEKFSMKQQ